MTALEVLFDRFRRGDAAALAAVYDRTAPGLLRTALHLAPSPAAAEDLLQATFVAAMERAADYDPARPLLPWLAGILANQAKLARWRDRRTPDPRRLPPRETSDPVEHAARHEFTRAVDDAIARLPARYQPVLVLHLRHGLAPADIAHALRRPPGTVRAQLARGLQRLRQRLPQAHVPGVAGLATGRGLAAVRASLFPPVPAAAAVAAGTLSLLGLGMKKLLITAVLLAAAIVAYSLAEPGDASPPGDPSPSQVTSAELARPAAPDAEPHRRPGAVAAYERDAVDPVHPAGLEDEPAPAPTGVEGVVHFRDGRPAAGVAIVCEPVGPHGSWRRVARCNERGRFRIEGLEPAFHSVRTDRGGEKTTSVKVGRLAFVRLRIPLGLAVRGRVRDPAGAPIAGASIWLGEKLDLARGEIVATSAADGTFAIESVGIRRYVGARAAGFEPSALVLADGTPGDAVELDLVLRRGGARVAGRVTSPDGDPVAAALVRVAPPGHSPGSSSPGATTRAWSVAAARTGSDGRFALTGLPAGALIVHAAAPGHGAYRTRLDVPAGGTAEILAVLPPPTAVTGTITDAGGEPVPGAIVRYGDWEATRLDVTFCDRTGRYALAGIAPGDVTLVAMAGSRELGRTRLSVGPGATATWSLVVEPRRPLRGRVVDEAGDGIDDADVDARRGDATLASATTGAGGAFELAVEGDDPLTLRVGFRGRGERVLTWMPIQSVLHPVDDVAAARVGGVTVVVPESARPAASVRGRILLADGRPAALARVRVHFIPGLGAAVTGVDPATGEFSLERLPAGEFRLAVEAPGSAQRAPTRHELAAGAALDLGDIGLAAGAVVTGTLVRPAGVDASPRLTVYDPAARVAASVTVRGDTFECTPLPPGTYRLVAVGEGIARGSWPLVVGPSAPPPATIVLLAGRPRRMVVPAPPADRQPRWIWFTVFRGGELLGGGDFQQQPDGSWATDLWVEPHGSYRLMAGTDREQHGDATFAGDGTGPVTVELRPRR